MEKIELHNHVGATIIGSNNINEFLIGYYDDTFPKALYRGRVCLIGGNHSLQDNSPQDLFFREIREEFSVTDNPHKNIDRALVDVLGEGRGAPEPTEFADVKDIDALREGIIEFSIPYQDYLVTIPRYRDIPTYKVIYSVFISSLPNEIFALAKNNLLQGKSIKRGGFARVTTIEELTTGRIVVVQGTPKFMLKRGELFAAAGTSPIIQDYLKTNIPNPEKVLVEVLGQPRESFREYSEFDYKNPIKK